MLGAPRQRMGVNGCGVGRNGRGGGLWADLLPQAGFNCQAPLAPLHRSRAAALVFFPSSFSNEKEDPRAGAPPLWREDAKGPGVLTDTGALHIWKERKDGKQNYMLLKSAIRVMTEISMAWVTSSLGLNMPFPSPTRKPK